MIHWKLVQIIAVFRNLLNVLGSDSDRLHSDIADKPAYKYISRSLGLLTFPRGLLGTDSQDELHTCFVSILHHRARRPEPIPAAHSSGCDNFLLRSLLPFPQGFEGKSE